MKITIISLDLYGFVKHIADELQNKNIEVNNINSALFRYKYKNFGSRIANFFSKILFNKNIKKEKKTEYLLEKIGNKTQDITLVVDPAHFNHQILKKLRNNSKKLIAYNYDSYAQLPIPKDFRPYFDEIYSFDKDDCKTHNLKFITNYIYLPKEKIAKKHTIKAFTIQSYSKDRIHTISKIADAFDAQNIPNYEFFIYGKKRKKYNKKLIYIKNRIPLEDFLEKMKNSEILFDVVRNNQKGLSFRIFEALALQKKIITTNKAVAEYDFYNTNNILIIDEKNPFIPKEFLEKPYTPIEENTYNKYTINQWIKTVFDI